MITDDDAQALREAVDRIIEANRDQLEVWQIEHTAMRGSHERKVASANRLIALDRYARSRQAAFDLIDKIVVDRTRVREPQR